MSVIIAFISIETQAYATGNLQHLQPCFVRDGLSQHQFHIGIKVKSVWFSQMHISWSAESCPDDACEQSNEMTMSMLTGMDSISTNMTEALWGGGRGERRT